MKIIFPYAKAKARGGYLRDPRNRRILFVAHPELVADGKDLTFARPDDLGPDGQSWREHLSRRNASADPAIDLHRAIDLYLGPAFPALKAAFRPDNGDEILILSAGWGLVRSDFRLPQYDITFGAGARRSHPHTHRAPGDRFHDFNMLDLTATEMLVFIGGTETLPAFQHLTRGYAGPRLAFHHSRRPPVLPGCTFRHFAGKRDIMWPHDCAAAVAAARLEGRDIASVGDPAAPSDGFAADDPFSLWQVRGK